MKLFKTELTPPLVAISACLFAVSAQAFTHSSVITASGYSGTETLKNFPVLVKIDASHVPGFSYDLCREDGRDISFTSVDGLTKYSYEVDTWNPGGTSLVWVKIPELTATTQFVFAFGDKTNDPPAVGDREKDVWADAVPDGVNTNFYIGVWHMSESAPTGKEKSPDAAKRGTIDMTAIPDINGQGGDGTYEDLASASGIVGGCRMIRAEGSTHGGQTFRIPAFDSAYSHAGKLTFTAWVRGNTGFADGVIYGGTTRNNNWGRLSVRASSATEITASGSNSKTVTASGTTMLGNWTHIVVAYNGASATAYYNGVPGATAAIQSVAVSWKTAPDIITLGANCGNGTSGGVNFAGRFDEFRILKGVASADWVKAEYDTVASDNFLVAAEAVEGEVVDADWTSEPHLYPVKVAATASDAAITIDGVSVEQGVVNLTLGSHTVAVTGGGDFIGWAGALGGETSPTATFTLGEEGAFVAAITTGGAAGTITWTATEEGEWYDAANWDLGRVPGAGDAVVLPSGAKVRLDAPTPALASLTVASGATLVPRNWFTKIDGGAVTVSGTVKLDGYFFDDEMSNRVWIAGTTLTVQAGGRISADAAGYAGRNGPAWVGATKRSFYNTSQAVGTSRFGGAYGGGQALDWRKCTSVFSSYTPPHTYGSAEWPFDPGSGAGSYSAAGGGAIYLDFSGPVTIDGAVTADSNRRNASWDQYWPNTSGNGSGGGIVIVCGAIAGHGKVSASGTTSRNLADDADTNGSTTEGNQNGGDGGGRIAVHYDAAAQAGADCRIIFAARPGVSMGAAQKVRPAFVGGLGSLWFTDDQLLTSAGYLADGWKFAGVWYSGSTEKKVTVAGDMTCADGPVFSPGYDVELQGNLTVTGAVSWAGGFGGHDSAVAIAGDLVVSGAKIDFTGGTLTVGGDFIQDVRDTTDPRTGAEFVVHASPTNGTENAYGFAAEIHGTWRMKNQTVCYPWCHETDGAIPHFWTERFTMDEGAVINADQKGYEVGYGPAAGRKGSSPAHGCEGGYIDSSGKTQAKSDPYDLRTNPCMPGVSCGSANLGGGVVYIFCDGDMVVNGAISADANSTSISKGAEAGGSSGGAINLTARKFTMETGTLHAKGGRPKNESGACQGSPGRIAVWYRHLMTDGLWDPETEEYDTTKIDVTAVPNGTWNPSGPGTVWFGVRKDRGLMLLVR